MNCSFLGGCRTKRLVRAAGFGMSRSVAIVHLVLCIAENAVYWFKITIICVPGLELELGGTSK